MLLTIITVNKNSGYLIEKTAKSIIYLLNKQKDISWLIVDSNSKDESYKSIQKILRDKKKLQIDAIIEDDNGIYDAMNKAIIFTNSKFLLFINSGDTINTKTLLMILNLLKSTNNSSIICGYRLFEEYTFFVRTLKRLIHKLERSLKFSLPSSHNSIIYLTQAIKGFPFNEEYICASDYDQYLRLLNDNHKFVNKDNFKITNISNDGFIAKRKLESYQDCIKINFLLKNYSAFIYWKIKRFLLYLNLF